LNIAYRVSSTIACIFIAVCQRVVANEILGPAILKLDGVSAGLRRRIKHPTSQVQIAVMINADLSN
jgi:hypothetical protein